MEQPDRTPMQRAHQLQFVIKAELCALAPAAERIRSFFGEHHVGHDAIYAMEMVIEEIATNTIKYGFGNYNFVSGSKGSIVFTATADEERAELIIEDNGPPFDPTEAPDPVVHRALEQMPVGGLGIHLVRSLTDGFEYQRINHGNRVRVWVNRNKEEA
jgi:serine/threonine-protein kinase RsbW